MTRGRRNGDRDQDRVEPLVAVWDNLNGYVSRAMAEQIAARDWLTVCQRPPYAPELNPVEAAWSHLKRSLANLTRHNIGQLTTRWSNRPGRASSGSGRGRVVAATSAQFR